MISVCQHFVTFIYYIILVNRNMLNFIEFLIKCRLVSLVEKVSTICVVKTKGKPYLLYIFKSFSVIV